MKGFVIDGYKQPLQIADLPEPKVGERDVLVEIRAAAVNVLDAKIRSGAFKLVLPYKAPIQLGHDLAGVVVEVGSKVKRFTVGDEVYGRPRDGRIGTFAERLAVHEDDLARKPTALSMPEAASLPLVALTAWQALVDVAKASRGQKILIHAGSGGVGTIAIQLAKHLGLTVATTTGTGNVDWVGELGADTVIDYKTERFDEILSGYDIVLDSQGGDTLARSLRVLRPGGLAIGIAGPPDPEFARRQGLPLPVRAAIAGLSFRTRRAAKSEGVRYAFLFCRPSGQQLDEITGLVDSGALRPVIDRGYPFAETPVALAHVEAGRSKGKVVIEAPVKAPV